MARLIPSLGTRACSLCSTAGWTLSVRLGLAPCPMSWSSPLSERVGRKRVSGLSGEDQRLQKSLAGYALLYGVHGYGLIIIDPHMTQGAEHRSSLGVPLLPQSSRHIL
jgi:hypothetical protein